MEKLKIDLPIIVEGKYDKIKIRSIADACVIATDGAGRGCEFWLFGILSGAYGMLPYGLFVRRVSNFDLSDS